MNPIVLASRSPRRKALLQQINLKFIVHPSEVEEHLDGHPEPSSLVETLAQMKALDIATKYSNAMTIGADTVVVVDDHILGKPSDEEEAFHLLRKLSGRTHQVFSGVCLVITDQNKKQDKLVTFHAITNVTFTELSDGEINNYIRSGSPMDKAGAYGIQDDWGSLFVSSIDGDYYNVVGFPLQKFYATLKEFAPEYLPKPEFMENQ